MEEIREWKNLQNNYRHFFKTKYFLFKSETHNTILSFKLKLIMRING